MQLPRQRATTHVAPPGLAVTRYDVGLPPPTPGRTVTVALALPAAATGAGGATGGWVIFTTKSLMVET